MPMRKLVFAAFVGLLVLLLAAPASAQRDPFEDQGSGGQQDSSESGGEAGPFDPPGEGDDTTPEEPQEEEPGNGDQVGGERGATGSDSLPTTGADTTTWAVLAYFLVAAGLTAVAAARFFGPHVGALRSRRRR